MIAASVDRDPAFEAECMEYLTARGYRVTKARVSRRSAEPVASQTRSCVHCGAAPKYITAIGAKKPKDRHDVALCSDCYRFGPGLHATPFVAADPERSAKLYRVWRHAQHRYAATIRHDTYRGTYDAHPRLLAITKALNAAPMVRRKERSIAA